MFVISHHLIGKNKAKTAFSGGFRPLIKSTNTSRMSALLASHGDVGYGGYQRV